MQQHGSQQQAVASTSSGVSDNSRQTNYLHSFYDIIGKIGEGTYGVVYLARSKEGRSKMLAVKTFKPGKVTATLPAASHRNEITRKFNPLPAAF